MVDNKLLYLIAGLVIIFTTIAVPIQFDGNWVTMIWIAQAALLFTISKTKNIEIYEKLTYPLLILSTISLLMDWIMNAPSFDEHFTPIINVNYGSTLFFLLGLALIIYVQRKYQSSNNLKDISESLTKSFEFIVPGAFILLLFFVNFLDISYYFNQSFYNSIIELKDAKGDNITHFDCDLNSLKVVWLIIYSLSFISIMSIINIFKFKNEAFANFNLILSAWIIVLFLGFGLYSISELRASYINQSLVEFYPRTSFNLIIRYLSYLFVLGNIVISFLHIKKGIVKPIVRQYFNVIIHIICIWVLSSELLHWLDLFGSQNTYKLGLSILWGSYALFLISIGIWKRNQILRIGGMVLFGITLIKLFAYDIIHLGTIAKTIVFLSLGVLLLIISFLYNKYKNSIQDEEEH